jgi:hypothetical protein
MAAKSSEIREKDDRRRSLHRTSTAPPDAQEPQYHTYPFNIGAEEFNPFKQSSNINPQAKPFEPLAEAIQSSPKVELSAGAAEFVPTFASKTPVPKKASVWEQRKGPLLKSPTERPVPKEPEIQPSTVEKEIKEEKSVSTEEEQEDKAQLTLLTTDNNQTQQHAPALPNQIQSAEGLPTSLTQTALPEESTLHPQQISTETSLGLSEIATINFKEFIPGQLSSKTEIKDVIIEEAKVEGGLKKPEQGKGEQLEEKIENIEEKLEKIEEIEKEKKIGEIVNQEKVEKIGKEDKVEKEERTIKRYFYGEIKALESQVTESDVNPRILEIAARTIRPESWHYISSFKPHMRKKPRVGSDKRRHTIERPPIEENKDNPQWRFINEEAEKIAQKARETTKKITTVHEGDEKVQRQVKVTLNKLTPSNFEKLKESLLQTALDSEQNVKYVVDGIFTKACTESKYTQMYANLCKYLLEEYHKIKFNEEFGKSRENKRNNSFRRELLQNCQSVFEYNPQEENYEGLSEEDAHIKRDKLKKKILGNVKLIGELFKLGLILNKIVLYCIEDLIHPKFKNESELDYSPHNFNEEKLEGACILLRTGGLSFEKPSVVHYTNKVFRVLQQIVDRNIASARTIFLIMNVIDARKAGWRTQEQELPQVIA